MKLIGTLLTLNAIALSAWWISGPGTHKASVLTLCSLSVFAGLSLILGDRITELTVKGVGSIKAAAKQVEADAGTVADLRARVESQSATVDLVAQDAAKAKRLSQEVSEKNDRAEERLHTLDEAISRANQTLLQLESTTEFTMTVVAAQNDDRTAFDRLNDWSKDPDHPYQKKAQQAWNTIFDSHSSPMSRSGFSIPWSEGIDPSALSISELQGLFRTAPPFLRVPLLEYTWKRDDIPLVERLDFLMSVMETDSSLQAVEYAGRYFTGGTKQKIKPLAVEHLSNWWKEHRQEFTSK